MMLLVSLAIATLLVAFANGANDNFKGVATLHGSGLLSYRKALLWGTITTFAGSLAATALAGALVRRFSGKGLVSEAIAGDPSFVLAVGIGASLTVLLATRLGFPISTTHALIGALLGAGAALAGPGNVAYGSLGALFVLPLLVSPFAAALLASGIYAAIRAVRRFTDWNAQTCVCVAERMSVAAHPSGAALRQSAGLEVTMDHTEECARHSSARLLGLDVGRTLDNLHLLSGGAVGFARGLNDTPKIAALAVAAGLAGTSLSLAMVGLAMGAGALLAARRVAGTMSFGITSMTHAQGFSANVVTAALVSVASPLGLPVSTTHVSCGSLFGIGLTSGTGQWGTVRQILAAWLITLPVAAAAAAAVALLAR